MRVEYVRPNIFSLLATGHELAALMAGARMSLHLLEGDPNSPPEAREALRHVLHDYDQAMARMEAERIKKGAVSGLPAS